MEDYQSNAFLNEYYQVLLNSTTAEPVLDFLDQHFADANAQEREEMLRGLTGFLEDYHEDVDWEKAASFYRMADEPCPNFLNKPLRGEYHEKDHLRRERLLLTLSLAACGTPAGETNQDKSASSPAAPAVSAAASPRTPRRPRLSRASSTRSTPNLMLLLRRREYQIMDYGEASPWTTI